MRQAFRENARSVEGRLLRDLAQTYLLDGWEQSAVSVVASRDHLEQANGELGGQQALQIEAI